MVILHNLSAMFANRQLGNIRGSNAKVCGKLSSGKRINKASDDAAGLSISEKMRAQIRGLKRGTMNAQDGISLIQTAEGAMEEVQNIIHRMHELYVQNCNGTNAEEDRDNICIEVRELYEQIDRIANETTFNGKKLLDGTLTVLKIQYGTGAADYLEITIPDFKTLSDSDVFLGEDIFGVFTGIDGIGYGYSANAYLGGFGVYRDNFVNPDGTYMGPISNRIKTFRALEYSLGKVNKARSTLGAMQNRLERIMSNNDNINENLQAAESRIRDCDMAFEMMQYTKGNIIAQSAQAMLAQANQSMYHVLSLLK